MLKCALENGGAAGKRGTLDRSLCPEFADIVIEHSAVSGHQHRVFSDRLREYQVIERVFVTGKEIQLLKRDKVRKCNVHDWNFVRHCLRVQIGA